LGEETADEGLETALVGIKYGAASAREVEDEDDGGGGIVSVAGDGADTIFSPINWIELDALRLLDMERGVGFFGGAGEEGPDERVSNGAGCGCEAVRCAADLRASMALLMFSTWSRNMLTVAMSFIHLSKTSLSSQSTCGCVIFAIWSKHIRRFMA